MSLQNVAEGFSGATPLEAANRLSTFAKQVAYETGAVLQEDLGGIPELLHQYSARASGESGSSFYLEISFEEERFVRTQEQIYPRKRGFGGGRITKRGASITLELRRETDGRYRWYGVPTELTENVKRVIPTDGGPFVLTEDYVADGLRALQETAR